MFEKQIYIIFVLLLSSGALSAGLEKVLRQAEFIADIYQRFPHSCIFIINTDGQQHGEDYVYAIYSSCVFVVKRNVITETCEGRTYVFLYQHMRFTSNYAILVDGKAIGLGHFIFTGFAKIVVTFCDLLCSEFVIF